MLLFVAATLSNYLMLSLDFDQWIYEQLYIHHYWVNYPVFRKKHTLWNSLITCCIVSADSELIMVGHGDLLGMIFKIILVWVNSVQYH